MDFVVFDFSEAQPPNELLYQDLPKPSAISPPLTTLIPRSSAPSAKPPQQQPLPQNVRSAA